MPDFLKWVSCSIAPQARTLTKQQKGKAVAIKKEEPVSATTGQKILMLKKKQTALES